MPILDAEQIPSEIKDQIEAASFDLAKGIYWVGRRSVNGAGVAPPSDTDEALQQLAQGYQRALTAIAMMVL